MADEKQKKQKSISPIGSALLGNSIDMGFGAIGSGIQTLFGIASSKYNADLEYQYNKKLADDAYQRQLDFWNLQNAYNTPAAQMSRLRQAGLNPALLNGGVQGNTAGNLSSVPTASVSAGGSMPSSPAANLGAMAETMSKLASAGMINEQTKYWLEQAIGAGIENDVKRILRGQGWSEAAIKEMDRAALWKAAHSDDDLPDNPYFDEWAQSDESVNSYVDTSENIKADTQQKIADTELKGSQKVLTDLQQATEQMRKLNVSADTSLKTQQEKTEAMREIALDLENKLTYSFGPMEHWGNINIMQAQYDKLVAEKGKIEADKFMLNANYQLELLKLEYQNLWVDKNINSNERQSILKNLTSLSESLLTIGSKEKKSNIAN